MKKAVTYYRVSTRRQGDSGLGLSAQRTAVRNFLLNNDYILEGEFIEIESGKNHKRPILQKALKNCRENNVTLLIAKLDRLARNVLFISQLIESGIKFKAVDNPFADKLLIHIMAAFAEHERDMISERTKVALKAAKKRGIELGYYGKHILSKENKLRADEFAYNMKPTINHIKKQGITSIRGITNELNRREVPTYRNNKWHINTVHLLLKRIEKL